jgi:hypothetical protein
MTLPQMWKMQPTIWKKYYNLRTTRIQRRKCQLYLLGKISKGCNQFYRNKLDKSEKRAVSFSEGLKTAKFYNIPFMEASAKTKANLREMFVKLVWEIIYHENVKEESKSKSNYCSIM